MFFIQDQISVAAKANLEAQFAFYTSLTSKTLESVEKLLDLNINAAKASTEESIDTAKQMLTAKDTQKFMSLVSAQIEPIFRKALAYSRHLFSIAGSTQVEYGKAAGQQFAQAGRKANELIEDAAKNAPAGSEDLIEIVKSAIDSTTESCEQLTKTGKQAAEALEANINAAMAQFIQATATAEK